MFKINVAMKSPLAMLPFGKADSRKPARDDLELWNRTVTQHSSLLQGYSIPVAVKKMRNNEKDITTFLFVTSITTTDLHGPRKPTPTDMKLWSRAVSAHPSLKIYAGVRPVQVSIKRSNVDTYIFFLANRENVTVKQQHRMHAVTESDLILWTECAQYSRFRTQVPEYAEARVDGTLFFFGHSLPILTRKVDVTNQKAPTDPASTPGQAPPTTTQSRNSSSSYSHLTARSMTMHGSSIPITTATIGIK